VSLWVRSGGVYRNVDFDDLYRRDGGVYQKFKELYVRNAGTYKLAWRADGPPPAPTSLAATAANGGIINTSWAWPANAENDYNRVEVQQVGDIGRISTNYAGTTQQRSGYANGSSVQLQARTVDNGGQVSAWVNFPAVSTVNALPGAANVSAFWWDGANFQVQWTDPGNPYGDISAVQVYYRNDAEGSWTLGGTYGTAGGLRQVALPGRGWDRLNHVFVRVVNAAGYTDSNIRSVWTPPQAGTSKLLVPHEGNSFAYTANAYRNDGTVRQGQFSATPMGTHFGLWFYGDQLYNAGHGYAPVSGRIFMIRDGVQGFTGPLFFTGHPYGWNPGVAPTGAGTGWTSTGVYAGADASDWEPIPSGVLASIASNEVKGIGIFTFSTAQSNYRVMLGPQWNAYAGIIELTW
jgi:hypothetical protein